MFLKEKAAQSTIAPVGAGSNFGEVVGLKGGGFMVVWVQQVISIVPVAGASDESGTAIFARTFDGSGKPSGKVIQVNKKTDGFQDKPDVTVLKNGNVLIAWDDGPGTSDFDVDAKAAILSQTGKVVVQEFALSSIDAGEQRIPHVVATPDGGFQAAWASADPGDRWHSQKFNAKGQPVGDEVPLNVYGGEDGKILSLSDNVKVVAGTQSSIYAWQDQSRIDSNGNLQDFDALYLSGEGYSGFESDMAKVGSDTFAVLRQDGFDVVLSLHRVSQFNPISSTETTGRTKVTTLKPADPGANGQTYLTLWDHETESPIAGTPNLPTYARPETELVELSGGDLLALYVVAVAGSGETDIKYELRAQLLTNDGTRLGDAQVLEEDFTFAAGGQIIRPFGAQGKNGDVFVGWTTNTDRNGDGTVELTGGTYKLKYPNKTGNKAITEGDDDVYGGKGSDKLDGGDGSDVLFGLGGKDRFDLSEGDDQAFGGVGDDTFVIGTLTGDTNTYGLIDGGNGTDRLDLRYLPGGATVGSLITSNGPYGYRGFQTRNLEELVGSEFDDVVSLTSGASVGLGNDNDYNRAWLRGGDDQVTLFPGAQTVDGGSGFDTAMLNFVLPEDVTIRQTKKAVILIYDDPRFETNDFKHTLTGFEELKFTQDGSTMRLRATNGVQQPEAPGFGGLRSVDGNGKDNVLTGKNKSERFDAGGGKDKVQANGGDDVVFGGGGKDTLLGGAGRDILRGDAGNDTIRGGTDDDHLEGGLGNDKLFGEAGDDNLLGNAGRDVLNGAAGNDTLDGGKGNDTLKGGDGNDSFVFLANAGKDVVQDFDVFGVSERDNLTISSTLLADGFSGHGQEVVDTYAEVRGGKTVFTLEDGNMITLAGVTDLTAISSYVYVDYYN